VIDLDAAIERLFRLWVGYRYSKWALITDVVLLPITFVWKCFLHGVPGTVRELIRLPGLIHDMWAESSWVFWRD
jgi:hypothetical protein